MSSLKHLLIIIFILISFSSNALEKNLENKITKNLRCLVCQGQSIYDSDTQFANSIKILVKKKLDDGLSEKHIYGYLKNKYGDWILYDPEFGKKDLLFVVITNNNVCNWWFSNIKVIYY